VASNANAVEYFDVTMLTHSIRAKIGNAAGFVGGSSLMCDSNQRESHSVELGRSSAQFLGLVALSRGCDSLRFQFAPQERTRKHIHESVLLRKTTHARPGRNSRNDERGTTDYDRFVSLAR